MRGYVSMVSRYQTVKFSIGINPNANTFWNVLPVQKLAPLAKLQLAAHVVQVVDVVRARLVAYEGGLVGDICLVVIGAFEEGLQEVVSELEMGTR